MRELYTPANINAALSRVAVEITRDLGPQFTMVPILTGGFILAADLIRALTLTGADPEVDFVQLSSYGKGRESSGLVRFVKDITAPVSGLVVLLVDDVLDSGRSLFFAQQRLIERGALRVATCVAVEKTVARRHAVTADYALFRMTEDAFLVGYGMDDAGGRRGLPSIYAVD